MSPQRPWRERRLEELRQDIATRLHSVRDAMAPAAFDELVDGIAKRTLRWQTATVDTLTVEKADALEQAKASPKE